jgi:hypothetical protein
VGVHIYVESDPMGSPPANPGYGAFPAVQVPDDTDDRDAASEATGLEALADRDVWIRHRLIDWVEGGTYNNALLTFTGPWDFQGVTTFTGAGNVGFYVPTYVVGGATLNIGGPFLGAGHLHLNGTGNTIDFAAGSAMNISGTLGSPSTVTWNGTGTIAQWNSGSALTMAAGSVATLNGTNNVGGPVTRTSVETRLTAGAYTKLRINTITNSSATVTIDGTSADIFLVSNSLGGLGGGQTVKIQANAAYAGHVFCVRQTISNPGNDVFFEGTNAPGVELARFRNVASNGTTFPKAAIWFFYDASGNPKVLSVWTGLDGDNTEWMARQTS